MFVFKDGKLYLQDGDKIVGVNLDSLGSTIVKGTSLKFDYTGKYCLLSAREAHMKFQTSIGGKYKFPVAKKKPAPKVEVEKE